MYRLRVCNMGASGLDHMARWKMLFDTFFKILFNATQFKSRHHFTIWQFSESIPVAGNTGKFLNMTVPGFKIFIADGPVNSKAISYRSFKIKITPALCLPCPK